VRRRLIGGVAQAFNVFALYPGRDRQPAVRNVPARPGAFFLCHCYEDPFQGLGQLRIGDPMLEQQVHERLKNACRLFKHLLSFGEGTR
jgi:hypothetical protein